jgi:hypothetical protein
MTERPAHDEDCEDHLTPPRFLFCACSYRASIVALERDLAHAQREYEGPMAEEIVRLRKEREEDRAAILEARTVTNWHYQKEWRQKHAAAIARAQERP